MNPACQGQIHSQLTRSFNDELNESQRPSSHLLHPNGYAGGIDLAGTSDLEGSLRSTGSSRRSGQGRRQNRHLIAGPSNPIVIAPGASHRPNSPEIEDMGNSRNFQSSGDFDSDDDEGKEQSLI